MSEEKQMTSETHQIGQDLQFVKSALGKRGTHHRMPSIVGLYWAAYVLVGYPMLDFKPKFAPIFLMAAGITGGIFSGWIGRRESMRLGERDQEQGRREALHWATLLIAVIGVVALGSIQHVNGYVIGQFVALTVGVVYLLAGVHYDHNFLWLGLLIIVGSIAISFIPRFGWTALGVVLSAGLVIAAFLNRREHTHA
jgi:hypothetical protein